MNEEEIQSKITDIEKMIRWYKNDIRTLENVIEMGISPEVNEALKTKIENIEKIIDYNLIPRRNKLVDQRRLLPE